MCSQEIINLSSCYIDNWQNIIHFLVIVLSLGLLLGFLVAVMSLLLKN